MTYAANLWLFFVLLFGIIIVPGMDMFFVMANSLTGGRLRGLAATAGIMLGGIFHTLFGAFFIGALTTLAPQLITIILIASACYMGWIGWTLLRSSITVDDFGKSNTQNNWAAFWQGLMTCLLNPKAYVFVLGTYPVFIKSEYGPVWPQALVMGILTITLQLFIYGGLGLAAAQAREKLISNPQVTIWIGRSAGALFIAVATLTLWHVVASLL